MNSGKVKVGIIGSQFEADIHAASFQIMPEEAEVCLLYTSSRVRAVRTRDRDSGTGALHGSERHTGRDRIGTAALSAKGSRYRAQLLLGWIPERDAGGIRKAVA